MGRYLVIAVIALLAPSSARSQEGGIYGSWRIDNIVYTFTRDSLYIDDEVEGFAYLFHRDSGDLLKITYDSNVNGITGTIQILYMDRVKMVARFTSMDDVVETGILFREPEYHFRLFFSKDADYVSTAHVSHGNESR